MNIRENPISEAHGKETEKATYEETNQNHNYEFAKVLFIRFFAALFLSDHLILRHCSDPPRM